MKGNISLKDFIKGVKEELISSLDNETPFFEINDVQLEVSFGVEVEAEAGFKFFVFDAKAKGGASQSHKVTINLTPFVLENPDPETSPQNPKIIGSKVSAKKSPVAKKAPAIRGRAPTAIYVGRDSGTGKFLTPEKPKKKPVKKAPTAKK